MHFKFSEIEKLLPGYLSGDLSDKDRAMMDEWRNHSPENEVLYQESLKAWESIPLLHEMEKFNSFEALKKINSKISKTESRKWWITIQRIAAILLLPLLIYSAFSTFQNISLQKLQEEHVVMQTISSRQGMVSKFALADGTKVWLNSDSELQFPTKFSGALREVKLKGEAFFEVTKNERHPFRVNANELKVDVLGTRFNVINYDDDTQVAVILVEGKVKLSSEKGQVRKVYGTLLPGQRAVYNEINQKVEAEEVNVDKYIAWLDGNLIFREDKMEDVAKRLSRWFNVEIVINDPEIQSYVYKANFRNENLTQVLNLLKLSAPIDFKIIGMKEMTNGEFSKQKVYLMKKKI